jgi:pheromone a factor receptor
MGLAGIEVLCTVPLACYSIYLNLTSVPLQAYVSWDYAHANFGLIDQIPSVAWQADPVEVLSIELSRWFIVICAVVFFAFFGFADEARRNYRLALVSVAKRVGLSTGSISDSGTWTVNGYVTLKSNFPRAASHGFYSLYSSNPDVSHNSRSATIPVFVTHQMEKKRDSLASFSSRISLPDYGGALADVKGPVSPTASSSGSRDSPPRSPVDSVSLPTLPGATLDTNAPPRYAPDVPHAV